MSKQELNDAIAGGREVDGTMCTALFLNSLIDVKI